jgi:hypothetical protein
MAKYLSYSNIYPKCLYVKKIHLAHILIFFKMKSSNVLGLGTPKHWPNIHECNYV